MPMKQTQTKLFEFSDTGLDFCAGSKNLFPDRFKKMLSLGYNVQTVTSVAVAGNQVTFTYGGAHGYVADRVLKVDSGDLSLVNAGEFWIDSVTTNTVTMTIEGTPPSVTNGFTTRIAPLGWSLEYESAQVQMYKMKYLDDRDLYVRFVFPVVGNFKNTMNVCVGKTADLSLGVITDDKAYWGTRNNTSIVTGFQWMFTTETRNTHDNYTYTQGQTTYGKGVVVGSAYHLTILTSIQASGAYGRLHAILPFASQNYDRIDYPVVIGRYSTTAENSSSSADDPQFANIAASYSHAYIGNRPVAFAPGNSNSLFIDGFMSVASFLPTEIESFNTVIAKTIQIYDGPTRQYLGNISGGVYQANFSSGTLPGVAKTAIPQQLNDADNNSICMLQPVWRENTTNVMAFFVVPVEEIKIV